MSYHNRHRAVAKRARAASLADSRRSVMRLLLLALLGLGIALIPFIAKAEETLAISAIPVPPANIEQPIEQPALAAPAPAVTALPDSGIIAPDAPAAAQPSSVQDVIKAQLAAIRDRDADAAYALMTHDFHEENLDALTFLATMRFDQRAIYNHEEYTFLDKQGTGPVAIQKVRMNDHYGDPVTVIYRLEEQGDGSWLIDSFTILNEEAQPI